MMKAPLEHTAEHRHVPTAKVTGRPRLNWIWVVPIVAGLIGAWLVFQDVQKKGPTITIRFDDGKGMQPGQTVVRYRGTRVGEVQSVELTKDLKTVVVKVRLSRTAANLAREGSKFWVVKADVSGGTISGLDTIVGGPYIEAMPGEGPEKRIFDGLKEGPAVTIQDPGLDITLTWPQLGWLNPGAPLYYRGVEVGLVRDYSLDEEATNILIRVHVQKRFAPLVRQNSQFWNAGGIKADISLFHGVSVSAESLKSLLEGGIAFATPSPPGVAPGRHQVFPLHEKPEEKWTKWAPPIDIGPPGDEPKSDGGMDLQPLRPNGEIPVPKT
jgi:paraquat-inducible protein B